MQRKMIITMKMYHQFHKEKDKECKIELMKICHCCDHGVVVRNEDLVV